MANVMRVWLDELERLPEYSASLPTGTCTGKTWKTRHIYEPTGFVIGQFGAAEGNTIRLHWFSVALLQGPRRRRDRNGELRRFKTRCTRAQSAQEKGK